tara:strand:+ start:3924 stop:4217 length:294 start_codon:yes stop_codon:yes gene_type:complete
MLQDDMNPEIPQDSRDLETSEFVIGDNDLGYSPLQSHYLTLLGRLVDVQNEYKSDPEAEDWLMKAIQKSVYSAYCDCIEAEIGDPAKLILEQEQQVN